MPYVFNPFTGTFDWTSAADVTGPSSATDNALARFDGTTGKLIKNSSATLTDAGALSTTSLTLSNIANTGVVFGNATGQLTTSQSKAWFDDFRSHLGVAQSFQTVITNGGFNGSALGWSLPTGWAYGSNAVSHNANGTGALSQNITTPVLGDRWELRFTISNLTAGTVSVNYQGTTWGANLSQNGTYIYRGIITNSSNINFTNLTFTPSNTARFTIDDVSLITYVGGTIRTGDLQVAGSSSNQDGILTITAQNKSNGTPGDTRHASLQNNGLNTWIDFRFSGIDRSHIGATSSGEVSAWVSGGNWFATYNKNTGSPLPYSYNAPSTFTHGGYGSFGVGVNAGSSSNPTSTLVSQGGTALKVKRITVGQVLDNTATEWIADASTPTCVGTPTALCSTYTNEVDCLARDAHGGCSWFAGYNCSTFNGDQTACEGQTGCTYESASCSGFGDQTTCESYSGCSWTNNPQSCAGFDETTCTNTTGCTVNMAGCTVNYDQCSNYNNDQTGCDNANGGGFCTYDSGTGDCTGGQWFISCSGGAACSSQPDESSCQSYSYFDNCSGNYDSYSCTGSYYTGNCTGTYGAACSGTAACNGIDDQTNCNNEAGCNWATAITLTLPDMVTCPDRDYWIYNGSSSNADVIIEPHAGQQIDHTTSYTLSNFKDWLHISPFRHLESCGSFNEATCGSTTGCTQQYANCVWDGSACTGDPSCAGYGDESSCNSATYYSGCSGSYIVSENWYVFGR